MARRTQAERSDATSRLLVETAERMFGQDGYAATSLTSITAAAGMTKGAAYHHFPGKAELFRAVFAGQQERIAAELAEAAAGPEPRQALWAGCHTFLRHCLDQGFRQISLLDGPTVLGWEGVRALQRDHSLRVLRDGMAAASPDASAAQVEVRSHLMFGALCEAGMILARSAEPEQALGGVAAEAESLLAALLGPVGLGPVGRGPVGLGRSVG